MKRIVVIVVGALVAIAMIPIIVISVDNITESKSYIHQVDLTVYTDNSVDITNYDVNFINDYHGSFISYTLSPTTVNGTLFGSPATITDVDLEVGGYGPPGSTEVRITINGGAGGKIVISQDGVIKNDPAFTGSFIPDTDYAISLLFEVTTPAQVTGVGAALLGLVPILFVVGTVFSLVIFTKELI